MANKRGRKPRLKISDFKAAGYKYKLDHLTKEEEEERKSGRKVIIDGKERTLESTDYDYAYKYIKGPKGDDIPVRIYHVNKDFFYKNVRLKSIDQLSLCEKDAFDNAHYSDLQSQVKDTRPLEDIDLRIDHVSSNADGTIDLKFSMISNDEITLKGGPMNGRTVKWSRQLPFFMTQINGTVPGTNPPAKCVIAVRYKRDRDDKSIYNYDPSI